VRIRSPSPILSGKLYPASHCQRGAQPSTRSTATSSCSPCVERPSPPPLWRVARRALSVASPTHSLWPQCVASVSTAIAARSRSMSLSSITRRNSDDACLATHPSTQSLFARHVHQVRISRFAHVNIIPRVSRLCWLINYILNRQILE
jgi:hypothetical protein